MFSLKVFLHHRSINTFQAVHLDKENAHCAAALCNSSQGCVIVSNINKVRVKYRMYSAALLYLLITTVYKYTDLILEREMKK